MLDMEQMCAYNTHVLNCKHTGTIITLTPHGKFLSGYITSLTLHFGLFALVNGSPERGNYSTSEEKNNPRISPDNKMPHKRMATTEAFSIIVFPWKRLSIEFLLAPYLLQYQIQPL